MTTEHRGSSYNNSCVKVPVDPFSRQPTPSYERPTVAATKCLKTNSNNCRKSDHFRKKKISNDATDPFASNESPEGTLENFLDFLESIPDYQDVHHLSNEQFKQRLDYLKRKQKLFLKNLSNSEYADEDDDDEEEEVRENLEANKEKKDVEKKTCRSGKVKDFEDRELKLRGKKCSFEESRISSPVLSDFSNFAGLAQDQDLLTYRCKNERGKEEKTLRNREIYSASKSYSSWSQSKSDESLESDADDDSIETKSLPPLENSKEWHPTVPKPFSFTLREDAEKYMSRVETEAQKEKDKLRTKKPKSNKKKRRIRPIPITSKIPLYDKLLAEKEERSRLVREESALNLLSQVKPFNLECDRRAWKCFTRSSPELYATDKSHKNNEFSMFKAKPVPKNLFGTEIYDRMLEDDYYRQLQKKIRASELMKSSSLPPSMARRARIQSAATISSSTAEQNESLRECRHSSSRSNVVTPSALSDRLRSSLSTFSTHGTNLAAILRCQYSREKLEREIREKMEEKRREQAVKLREALIGRQPAWRALRSAARHEHERDLYIRTSLRRDEAREQAERHRLQMELMLNRVTRIPTLFQRYSQSFQHLDSRLARPKSKNYRKKKKELLLQERSSSIDSYPSIMGSSSRPDSDSLTSSTENTTPVSLIRSSSKSSEPKSVNSLKSDTSKRRNERKPLKVSIKETAELIEDKKSSDKDSEGHNENTEDIC